MKLIIKPSHEEKLIEFLKTNNFTYEPKYENNPLNREHIIVINVIKRFYFTIDKFFIYPQITQEEFYRKINYHPKEKITHEKIYTKDNTLLYEGYKFNGYPYGLGTVYFDNGNIFQEGIFDFKGLKAGREYYYSGQLKFEGIYAVNYAYGPNFPLKGDLYDENGDLKFSGKFEIKRGGVGFPMIKYPLGYKPVGEHHPGIKYLP